MVLVFSSMNKDMEDVQTVEEGSQELGPWLEVGNHQTHVEKPCKCRVLHKGDRPVVDLYCVSID